MKRRYRDVASRVVPWVNWFKVIEGKYSQTNVQSNMGTVEHGYSQTRVQSNMGTVKHQ